MHLFGAHETLRLQKLDNSSELLAIKGVYPFQTPKPALARRERRPRVARHAQATLVCCATSGSSMHVELHTPA